MIGRTLVADLAQRLPGDRVRGDSGAGPAPDARVEIDVDRFDRDGGGTALLYATLTLRDAAGTAIRSEALELAAPGTGAGSAAFTAAESRLLGQVADRAAAVLAAMSAARPAAMPPPAPRPLSPVSG